MSRLMLVLASAGMILVYLGLAIAGWGGFDAFFANPARIAVGAASGHRHHSGPTDQACFHVTERVADDDRGGLIHVELEPAAGPPPSEPDEVGPVAVVGTVCADLEVDVAI